MKPKHAGLDFKESKWLSNRRQADENMRAREEFEESRKEFVESSDSDFEMAKSPKPKSESDDFVSDSEPEGSCCSRSMEDKGNGKRKTMARQYVRGKYASERRAMAANFNANSAIETQADVFTGEFKDWPSFWKAWDRHSATNFIGYRRRQTTSNKVYNSGCVLVHSLNRSSNCHWCLTIDCIRSCRRTSGKKIPKKFDKANVWIWCKHGCYGGRQGTGVREHKHYQFTGCEARMKAEVVRKPDGTFCVRIAKGQKTIHNHPLTADIYSMYNSGSVIRTNQLVPHLDTLASADASVASITKFISAMTGTNTVSVWIVICQ